MSKLLLMGGGNVGSWSPKLLPGNLGYIQIPKSGDTSRITFGSGVDIISIADAGGGSMLLNHCSSSGQRPNYSTSSLLDGYANFTVTGLANSELTQTSGGPTGNVVHGMWGIFSTTTASGLRGLFRMGPPGSTNISSVLGSAAPPINAWGGRPTSASPVFVIDNNPHFFEKYYDGANAWLMMDGEIVAKAVDSSYNITTGEFGFGSAYSGMSDARVYAGGWLTGSVPAIDGTSPRHRLARWIASTYPSFAKNRLLMCFGDSQTAGWDVSAYPNNWPTRMATLGYLNNTFDQNNVCASPGYATANILSSYTTTGGLWRPSGLRPANIAVVWIGTNDLYTQVLDGAGTWSAIQTICSNLKNAGFKVVVVTCMDRQQGGTPGTYETQRLILNTAIRNGYTAVADALFDVASISQFMDSTNFTYFQVDKVHINTTGSDLFAQLIAPTINALS